MGPTMIYWAGLDYTAARAGLEGEGLAITPELWRGLRIMEGASCKVLERRGGRTGAWRSTPALVLTGDASSALAALEQTDGALGAAAEEAARFSQARGLNRQQIDCQKWRPPSPLRSRKPLEAKACVRCRHHHARRLQPAASGNKDGSGLLVETEHRATVRALNQARACTWRGGRFGGGMRRPGDANLGIGQIENVAAEMQGGSDIGAIIGRQGGQVSDAVARMGTQSGLGAPPCAEPGIPVPGSRSAIDGGCGQRRTVRSWR